MYGSIVSAVTQLLTPDLIAKMASAAGISDRTTAQKAVGAAVPASSRGWQAWPRSPTAGDSWLRPSPSNPRICWTT